MQKTYADFKLGVPDYVTVETEDERLVCQGGQPIVTAGATTVEFQDAGEHEDIFVTSEDAVRCVKLRWNYKIPKSARFLGDAWERTYGDVEWHGMSGNRYLPWYFLAKLSEKVLCFGVRSALPLCAAGRQIPRESHYFWMFAAVIPAYS